MSGSGGASITWQAASDGPYAGRLVVNGEDASQAVGRGSCWKLAVS